MRLPMGLWDCDPLSDALAALGLYTRICARGWLKIAGVSTSHITIETHTHVASENDNYWLLLLYCVVRERCDVCLVHMCCDSISIHQLHKYNAQKALVCAINIKILLHSSGGPYIAQEAPREYYRAKYKNITHYVECVCIIALMPNGHTHASVLAYCIYNNKMGTAVCRI